MLSSKPLFDARVLRHELNKHKKKGLAPTGRNLETIRSWHEKISGGLLDRYSETQIEQAFNSAIFIDILGYKPLGSDAETCHIVPKRTGSTGRDTPDFVLGAFNAGIKLERWRVVGEIKGLHTSLDLPQTSRFSRETPVQQAFRYALTGQPGVEWVVVTNFREIRLYRNGFMAAFHRWTLEELCNEELFTEFWLLLRQPHLAPETGESETLRILNASISAGLDLTEGFYGLYDLARQRLLKELSRQSSAHGVDIATLYGKAHKLLNRVLFAAFCEDHPAQLLPEETLKQLHDHARKHDREGSYWRGFQQFFSELDRGSPPGSPRAFNAFNGGLFAPDTLLDSIKIPNSLFTQPLTFQARGKESRRIEGVFGFHVYNFSEELDVDSLGAIFEQSLKDFPHHLRSVRGRGEAELTRRETTGVYYTPPSITRYLVDRAVDTLLEPVKAQLLQEVEQMDVRARKSKSSLSAEDTRDVFFLQKLMDRLKDVALIDPACGSGAFLIEAFHRMHREYETINTALGQLKGARPIFGLDRILLRNNLHGVDILGESVEITKLSLWLRTASKTEPLEKLDKTILCADALAEKRQSQFDIVISNPPWGADLDGWSDEDIKERFPQCGSEKDTAAMFVVRGWELLAPGGILAFVLPNSWLTVDGYRPFREWLLVNCEIVEVTNLWKIFRDVNHDVCLLVIRKPADGVPVKSADTWVKALPRGMSEDDKNQALAEERWAWSFQTDSSRWLQEPSARFETIYPPKFVSELTRVARRCEPLSDLFDVTVGIQVYHQRNVSREVIEKKAFHSDHRKGARWHPYISGNQVQRYFSVPAPNEYLFYNDALCDKRELDHYRLPRVLVQQIFWNRLSASLEHPPEPFMYLNTLFSVTAPKTHLDLGGVLAILNSRFVSSTYERWANRLFGDKFPKVSKLDLARIPIPKTDRKTTEQLNTLGAQLQERWSRLKEANSELHEYLQIIDPSGVLSRDLRQFWTLSRKEVATALGRRAAGVPVSTLDSTLERWTATLKIVDKLWGQISADEEAVEELVAWAYGMKPQLYSELIERAPAPKISDILLPRS